MRFDVYDTLENRGRSLSWTRGSRVCLVREVMLCLVFFMISCGPLQTTRSVDIPCVLMVLIYIVFWWCWYILCSYGFLYTPSDSQKCWYILCSDGVDISCVLMVSSIPLQTARSVDIYCVLMVCSGLLQTARSVDIYCVLMVCSGPLQTARSVDIYCVLMVCSGPLQTARSVDIYCVPMVCSGPLQTPRERRRCSPSTTRRLKCGWWVPVIPPRCPWLYRWADRRGVFTFVLFYVVLFACLSIFPSFLLFCFVFVCVSVSLCLCVCVCLRALVCSFCCFFVCLFVCFAFCPFCFPPCFPHCSSSSILLSLFSSTRLFGFFVDDDWW